MYEGEHAFPFSLPQENCVTIIKSVIWFTICPIHCSMCISFAVNRHKNDEYILLLWLLLLLQPMAL